MTFFFSELHVFMCGRPAHVLMHVCAMFTMCLVSYTQHMCS